MQGPAALFFTDLDGSLLDHHSYSFAAARPALARLEASGLPLFLATSKTLAEVVEIQRALGNAQPAIVENGGVIAFPVGGDHPFETGTLERSGDHLLQRLSPPYPQLRAFIETQRQSRGIRLRGFGDMSDAEVARDTGLSPRAAAMARERLCSEPFLWLDSGDRLQAFREAAAAAGLRVTRGGRYWHLMGDTGKARAMQTLAGRYFAGPGAARGTLVALGDSENDREMLQDADIAVVIRRHDGSHLDCHGRCRTIVTAEPGPAGWNSAVLQILDSLATGRTPA